MEFPIGVHFVVSESREVSEDVTVLITFFMEIPVIFL